jgi:ATP-dependent helicase HrpA
VGRATQLETVLLNSLGALAELRRRLAGLEAGRWPDTRKDIDSQLQRLLVAGFQRDTPEPWLSQYPRYMKALCNRVERLSGQYAKDQGHTALLQELGAPLWEALGKRPGLLLSCGDAMQYRWMLEELRVSLFAQHLGTRQAVSAKRLQEQWRAVARWLAANPH